MIMPSQTIATYVTQWNCNSHNRLLEMITPDEEKMLSSYNLGRLLDHFRGYKSYGYDNAMIQRAINWAKKRYKLTPIRMSNGHYEMGVGKTNYSPRNMRVYTTKRK